MPIPFATNQLPGGANAITTVEELVTWGNSVLQFNYPTNSYVEAANTNNIFHYIQPQLRIPTGELIIVNRSSVIMNEAAAQNLPIWKRVKGLNATTTIPSGFSIT